MIQDIARQLIDQKAIGVTGIIPAYHTLTVNYDFDLTSYQDLVDQIDEIILNANQDKKTGRSIIELPVCYNLEYGPDLQDVANYGKVSVEELIKLHTGTDYFIYMMGFLPGFAYMGSVPKQIAMPRLKVPRKVIAAGSVGVAGAQTGMYPVDSPGGWRLLGRTPIKLYDPSNPVLKYHSGDYVRFKAVDETEFKKIQVEDQKGDYQLKIIQEGGENNG